MDDEESGASTPRGPLFHDSPPPAHQAAPVAPTSPTQAAEEPSYGEPLDMLRGAHHLDLAPQPQPVQQASAGKWSAGLALPKVHGGNGPLYVGMRVQAQVTEPEGGDDEWHQGVVLEVGSLDQTCTVQFDDLAPRTLPAYRVTGCAPAPDPERGPESPGGPRSPSGPMPTRRAAPPPPGLPPELQLMGPPDVSALQHVPGLCIRQRVDFAEVTSGLLGGPANMIPRDLLRDVEVSNTYDIYINRAALDSKQRWMFAKEHSMACLRYCCQHRRELKLRVGAPARGPGLTVEERLGLVTSDQFVPTLVLERPFACCLSELEVRDGRGRQIGRIEEDCTNPLCCCPLRLLVDAPGGDYRVTGPPTCCTYNPYARRFDFEMNEPHGPGSALGTISTTPHGCCKACCGTADDYELKFASHATPDQRALLLAALFALDFAYFEAPNEDNSCLDFVLPFG